jgi:multiple sugar transport system substrate-binding protein
MAGISPRRRQPPAFNVEEKMKRIAFLSVLLCLVLSNAFAQAPTIPELKGKNLEITLWTHEDANRAIIEKKYIEEFKAANPSLTIVYSTFPSGRISETVATAFAANQGPDIFNLAITSAYSYIGNGRVAPVDYKALGLKDAGDLEDRYLAGMLKPVTQDGDIYGLPLEITNMALYLNKKIFREVGLDPEKDYPKTWEDVLALSEKMVKRNGQIITRRGFDFRYDGRLTTMIPMVEQLGGELISKDGKTAIVGDEAWLKVLQFFKDMGPGGKNLASPTYTAARTQFDLDKNEIAMSLSGLYQEARMKTANPAFHASNEWMIVSLPQWKDAKRRVTAHYSGHYYMVNAQSSKLEQLAAWSLVNYMLSHGEEYLSKVAIVQPTKALMNSPTYRAMPYSDVFTKDFATANIAYLGKLSSKIDTMLKTAFEGVMVGGLEPRKALDNLRAAANAALAEED